MKDDRTGQRIFDIKLQNNIVLEKCDIKQFSGSLNQAVIKEFKHISVDNDLLLELIPRTSSSNKDEAPILNFIEVIREDT